MHLHASDRGIRGGSWSSSDPVRTDIGTDGRVAVTRNDDYDALSTKVLRKNFRVAGSRLVTADVLRQAFLRFNGGVVSRLG